MTPDSQSLPDRGDGDLLASRHVLGSRAVTAALAFAQRDGRNVSRECVADMLAAAWRAASVAAGQDPSVDVANVNAAYVIERDDNARLRETLMRVNGLLSGGIDHHRSVGQACGIDACVLCLVEGIVREALNGGESHA